MLAATRVVASPAPTPATETTVPPSAHSATPARGSSSVVLGTTMAQEAPRRAPLTSAATSADPTARVEGTLSAAMTTTASASCRDCPAPVPAPAPALAPWPPPDPAGAPGMAFDPPCFSWRRIHNTASANPTLQRGESKQTTWRQHRHMTPTSRHGVPCPSSQRARTGGSVQAPTAPRASGAWHWWPPSHCTALPSAGRSSCSLPTCYTCTQRPHR